MLHVACCIGVLEINMQHAICNTAKAMFDFIGAVCLPSGRFEQIFYLCANHALEEFGVEAG